MSSGGLNVRRTGSGKRDPGKLGDKYIGLVSSSSIHSLQETFSEHSGLGNFYQSILLLFSESKTVFNKKKANNLPLSRLFVQGQIGMLNLPNLSAPDSGLSPADGSSGDYHQQQR